MLTFFGVCVCVSYNGIYAPCYEWVHTQTRIVYPIRKLSAASASSDETQALPLHTPRPATHLPATCRWPKSHPQGLWLGPNERMNGLWYVQWARVGGFEGSCVSLPSSFLSGLARNFVPLIFDFCAAFYSVSAKVSTAFYGSKFASIV